MTRDVATTFVNAFLEYKAARNNINEAERRLTAADQEVNALRTKIISEVGSNIRKVCGRTDKDYIVVVEYIDKDKQVVTIFDNLGKDISTYV